MIAPWVNASKHIFSRLMVATSVQRWAKFAICIAAIFMLLNVKSLSCEPDCSVPWLKATSSHQQLPPSYFSRAHPLQAYGNGSSMDTLSSSKSLFQNATSMRQQCKDSRLGTRIATATAHFSDPNNPEAFYQQSIRSHLLHNLVQDTQLHILCAPIIDDMWNKQAFLQLLLLNEMAKPPQERLEWIFWADRDTVILDYCRSPASFIPEAIRNNNATSDTAQDRDINLLITNDHNGLMAGVFIIRVCQWSVKFLSDVISFRDFRPDVHLAFSEQTAMELILQEDRNKKHVAYVPQHWMNNYRADTAENFINRPDAHGMNYWGARRGDFMVHFAGSGNKIGDILEYSGVGEEVFDRIQEGNVLRNASVDIEQFWAKYTQEKS